MKKNLIAIAMALFAVSAGAQTVIVHKTNGTTDVYQSASVKNVEFLNEKESEHGEDTGDDELQAVDLGLSVKWASFNVGASKPEDYGNYYAWGETITKDTYSSGNYTVSNSADLTEIGGTEKDAARTVMGSSWRMPTELEMGELINNCTWTWTQRNGINGYEVTGTNGNSIFLPAGGFMNSKGLTQNGQTGSYWTSTNTDYTIMGVGLASRILLNDSTVVFSPMLHPTGHNIRAVYSTGKTTTDNEWVQVSATGFMPYSYCPYEKTGKPTVVANVRAFRNTKTGAYKVQNGYNEYPAHRGYNKIVISREADKSMDKYGHWIVHFDYTYFEFTITCWRN